MGPEGRDRMSWTGETGWDQSRIGRETGERITTNTVDDTGRTKLIRGGRTRHYGQDRMDETTGTQRLRKCRTGQKEPPEGRDGP